MGYRVAWDGGDWRRWEVRDEATGRVVDRFFDRKAAELFAGRMGLLDDGHETPADAGRHDGERTDRATEVIRVNGELMDRAAAVLRTANAMGVCPVELARSLRGALAVNRTAVTS